MRTTNFYYGFKSIDNKNSNANRMMKTNEMDRLMNVAKDFPGENISEWIAVSNEIK